MGLPQFVEFRDAQSITFTEEFDNLTFEWRVEFEPKNVPFTCEPDESRLMNVWKEVTIIETCEARPLNHNTKNLPGFTSRAGLEQFFENRSSTSYICPSPGDVWGEETEWTLVTSESQGRSKRVFTWVNNGQKGESRNAGHGQGGASNPY